MAGAVCTVILAGAGADVIKVEPPDGDSFWALPACLQWQRGKRSIRLDLKQDPDRRRAQALAAQADVLVESFRPGACARLGIDHESLQARNPGLIYTSISGFGSAGPYAHYAGYEGIVCAKAGRMVQQMGQLERSGPIYSAVPVASFGAAQMALQGTLAALLARVRTGQGQQVETSLLRGLSAFDFGGWQAIRLKEEDRKESVLDQMLVNLIYKGAYLCGRTKDGHWIGVDPV